MKYKNLVSKVLLVTMLSLFAACSPGAGVFEISIQPAKDQTEVSALKPVKQVALSLLDSRNDWLGYIQFVTTPCTTAEGLGGPPKCAAGMADGTQVEVFPLSDAEGHYVTPETIDQVFNYWLKSLYAVYKVPSSAVQEPYWPAGEFGLLFERNMNDVPFPVTVFVENGKIVRIAYHYQSVEAQLQGIPIENVIIPPSAVDAWLNSEGD